MVVWAAVDLYTERAMVQADFAKHAALNKQMNVLVHSCEGDGRDAAFHSFIDFFRAGVPGHPLQDFKENLPLMGCREAVLNAQFAETDCISSSHICY